MKLRGVARCHQARPTPMIGPTAISGKFKERALAYFYTMLRAQPEPADAGGGGQV